MDNVDGKQARKTGNSSPLGLMVDHGADSINSIMLPLAACSLMQVGRSWYLPLTTICLTSGFYFATLQQYYCGRLDLPIINGVSDGCVIVYVVGLVSAFFGCDVWKSQAAFGLNIGQLVIMGLAIMTVPTLCGKYAFL